MNYRTSDCALDDDEYYFLIYVVDQISTCMHAHVSI